MLESSKGKSVISHRLQEKLSILKVSVKLELNRKISICTYDMMKCEDYGDLTPVEKYFAVSDITLQPDYNRSRRIPEVTQLSYYM